MRVLTRVSEELARHWRLLLLFAIFFVLIAPRDWWPVIQTFVLGAAVAVGTVWLINRRRRGEYERRRRELLCVRCGYPLAGVPAEPNGRICPECGARQEHEDARRV